jgi:hypothetical protein
MKSFVSAVRRAVVSLSPEMIGAVRPGIEEAGTRAPDKEDEEEGSAIWKKKKRERRDQQKTEQVSKKMNSSKKRGQVFSELNQAPQRDC